MPLYSFISKYFPTSLIIQECAIYFPNIFEFPIFSVIDFQFHFTVVREDTLHYFYDFKFPGSISPYLQLGITGIGPVYFDTGLDSSFWTRKAVFQCYSFKKRYPATTILLVLRK